MEKEKLKLLKENLKKGFYLQNFHKMISLCWELARSAEEPLPYYFLKSVFADIAERWEGEPLPVDKATVTQSFLVPEISNLLTLVEKQASKDALFDAMNDISSMCAKF